MGELIAQDTLMSLIRDLQSRVRSLETTSRLASSSLRDGTMLIEDASGNVIGIFGKQPDGTYGISILDVTGTATVFKTTGAGLIAPEMTNAVMDPAAPKAVTSGTFASVWRYVAGQIVSPGVEIMMPLTTDAGTSGEVRLSGVGGFFTSAFAIGASYSATNFVRWLHQSSLLAGPLTIDLQARRTAGAGNVNVYAPTGWTRDPNDCTTAGVFL